MKVLVVGSGAREHALVTSLLKDPAVDEVVCAPGNPGIAAVTGCATLDITDIPATVLLAQQLEADYVVVGPENPLVAGLADALRAAGIETFGPSAAAAQLEGSKAFAKAVMVAAGVPTAGAEAFATGAEAAAGLARFGPDAGQEQWVVKHDGLAAGKGVVVTADRAEAEAHCRATPGPVVLEEFLDGPEVSLFAVVTADGGIQPLLPAQDHKRAGDGDTGPNTGGMGAYAPLPWAPAGVVQQIMSLVIEPTVAEMARRRTPFEGLLYAGLAMTRTGIKVVEFNVRFGDPETQVVLALLETPLLSVLRGGPATFSAGSAVTVVVAAEGYPDAPVKGGVITGLKVDGTIEGPAVAFHAGTAINADGAWAASGGRVLCVTAAGAGLTEARATAYAALAGVTLAKGHFRTDIGARAERGEIAVAVAQGRATAR